MKWLLYFCLLLTGTLGYATPTILIDRYMSPFAGSADLLSIQKLLITSSDALFPGRNLQPNTTGKMWLRGFEQLFWYPLDNLIAVTQHEVFGHGYRLRQSGITPLQYHITPLMGGYTRWEASATTKVGTRLAIGVAGLEAEAIMARDMKMNWLRIGMIDGRESALYTQVAQSLFWYTLIDHLGSLKTNGTTNGDVFKYKQLLNASYPHDDVTMGKLSRLASLNLLDPMTFYAYYAFFYYIGTGEPWHFPTIYLRDDLRYLPNLRIGYAPYAPEVYLENYFTYQDEPFYFYLKGGRRSFGAGGVYDQLWRHPWGSMGLRVDAWNQQNYISSATLYDLHVTGTAARSSLNKRTWGGALSLTNTINLSPRIALYVELGGKTAGYLPGYSQSGDVIARIGIDLNSYLVKS